MSPDAIYIGLILIFIWLALMIIANTLNQIKDKLNEKEKNE